MNDRWTVRLQNLLPRRSLTRLMGRLAAARGGPLTRAAVRAFARFYGVDMAEAADPRIEAYASFNDFFTRALRPDARPLADAPFVCPVDGAISQFGAIDAGRIFQAKGHHYTATALLGGDAQAAAAFADGAFATLYLSPRDYHRIHMPCTGRLRRMVHVPGDLYSVNPATARTVPGLFARNERVVCLFDGVAGEAASAGIVGPGSGVFPFALVLVGATIVGSMATVWHGIVNPPRPGRVRAWDYPADGPGEVHLARGAEMGRFLLGSTVVLLFPPGVIDWNPAWAPGGAVRVGQAMGLAAAGRRPAGGIEG